MNKALLLRLLRIAALLLLGTIFYFLFETKWSKELTENIHPPSTIQSIRVGKEAKDFIVPSSDAYTKKTFQLSELHGVPVVLHFWATWCAPCQAELPELLKIAPDLRKAGISIVTVAEDKDWLVVERFFVQNPDLKEMKNLMVLLLDPEGRIANLYGSEQFPETYLINQKNFVDNKFVGAQSWTNPGMQVYFDSLKNKEAK